MIKTMQGWIWSRAAALVHRQVSNSVLLGTNQMNMSLEVSKASLLSLEHTGNPAPLNFSLGPFLLLTRGM